MAIVNILTGNPAVITDFGEGDVTVSTRPITISSIVAAVHNASKTLIFIDNDGNVVFQAEVPQDKTFAWRPCVPFTFHNGLIFDDSASDFSDAGLDPDALYVFKV
jgi:hypothetical protein